MEGVKHYGLQQSWHFQEQIDRCFSCFVSSLATRPLGSQTEAMGSLGKHQVKKSEMTLYLTEMD